MFKSGFHPFHILDPSPWPLVGSFSVGSLLVSSISYMQSLSLGALKLTIALTSVILVSYQWWRDVVRESTYQGCHSVKIQKGLVMGISLFITSELFFFASFFGSFYFTALNPDVNLGSWPPVGVQPMEYMEVPLVNTVILLSSGVSVTYAHHSLMEGNLTHSKIGTCLTVALGLLFTVLQGWEYFEASFTMADSVYGSLFFISTGFHGFHVIVGGAFISVCLLRMLSQHFSSYHHIGFEGSIWYWHFVDVVWLFLFLSIYWWGA